MSDPNYSMQSQQRNRTWSMVVCLLALWSLVPVSAWSTTTISNRRRTTQLQQSGGANGVVDDEIVRLQRKARVELDKAKAKMQANAAIAAAQASTPKEETSKASTPFFASVDANSVAASTAASNNKRNESVIKSVNQETGLFTIDGEKMAALSETEQWERRSLSQVFDKNEVPKSRSLADRDVAASIYNLRKSLQTSDFQKIFDPRNRFIGETD